MINIKSDFNNAKKEFSNTIVYTLAANIITGFVYKLCQYHLKKTMPIASSNYLINSEKNNQQIKNNNIVDTLFYDIKNKIPKTNNDDK